jgi:multicomponent Na+:H+ antiporter subunit F
MTPLDVGLAGFAIAFLLGLVRVVAGPSLADRAIAADLCFLCVVGVLVLISVQRQTVEFIDVALVATLLGFLATVALAWLITERRR